MFVYCFYCQAARCARIADVLGNCGVDRVFSPRVVSRFRKQGELMEKRYDLLPGYVFAFHHQEIPSLRDYRWLNGLVREVGRAEDHYELTGTDRDFALALYEQDGVISTQQLIREGESVVLKNSPFSACRGEVTAVDYRKQRAKVEFVFDGLRCASWVAVEVVRL